ncbi:hypothetical protein VKT23_009075 [Stygiomarasmius scandens]|uniref:Uncharacterized protein n=1 Tax=Marasmiellus scandens TaxID=2682957 RepID=A0ABR1JJ67_9AGAR
MAKETTRLICDSTVITDDLTRHDHLSTTSTTDHIGRSSIVPSPVGILPNYQRTPLPSMVWKSAPYPYVDEGQVQEEYWYRLQERTERLMEDACEIWASLEDECWPGFLEACPSYREEKQLWERVELITFDAHVERIARIQSWVKELAAWVRMGRLLQTSSPNHLTTTLQQASTVTADDDIVGLWINGLDERTTSWFWQVGRVPIFVMHQIRGQLDDPGIKVDAHRRIDNPLKGTPLYKTKVEEDWTKLAKASQIRQRHDTYEVGIDTTPTTTSEARFRWHSASIATRYNYPGQEMRQPMGQTGNNGTETNARSVQIAEGHERWIEPLVIEEVLHQGSWEHFQEDFDDEGVTCFNR